MIKVRRGIFETNSSSIHCLCVAPGEYTVYPTKHCKIHLGEFGWESDYHYGTYDKLSYLVTAIKYLGDDERLDKLTEALEDIGITFEIIPSDWYYVDHAGELISTLDEFLDNRDLLYRFLFNDDSFIVTFNDNGYYPEENREVSKCESEGYDIFWKVN